MKEVIEQYKEVLTGLAAIISTGGLAATALVSVKKIVEMFFEAMLFR